MTFLLDSNVLVALSTEDHAHHQPAQRWWSALESPRLATCPITQGALLRVRIRDGTSVGEAQRFLGELTSLPNHEFWPDDLGYPDADLSRVTGYRQVTDAYLAALARHHGGTLATFDKALAALHPDVCELVPVM